MEGYSAIGVIGAGSYASVVLAMDEKNRRKVAIKHISNINGDQHCTKYILREINLLSSLRHKNIISMYDIKLYPKRLCVVTEYCECDLKKLSLKAPFRNPLDYIKVLYQILEAVGYIHSVGVLHRDIKPENILVDLHLNVKLCDFGLSKVIGININTSGNSRREPLTEYMVTRWYRSPEVILNPGRYGEGSDVWAAACSFAELVNHYPLFPGSDAMNQIKVIVESTGTLSEDDMEFEMTSRSRTFISKLRGGKLSGTPMERFIQTTHKIHPFLLNVLDQMLHFNPNHRISAKNALTMPLFDDLRSQTSDPESPIPPISWNRYKRCMQKIDVCVNDAEVRMLLQREVSFIAVELNRTTTTAKCKAHVEGKDVSDEKLSVSSDLSDYKVSHRRSSTTRKTKRFSTQKLKEPGKDESSSSALPMKTANQTVKSSQVIQSVFTSTASQILAAMRTSLTFKSSESIPKQFSKADKKLHTLCKLMKIQSTTALPVESDLKNENLLEKSVVSVPLVVESKIAIEEAVMSPIMLASNDIISSTDIEKTSLPTSTVSLTENDNDSNRKLESYESHEGSSKSRPIHSAHLNQENPYGKTLGQRRAICASESKRSGIYSIADSMTESIFVVLC